MFAYKYHHPKMLYECEMFREKIMYVNDDLFVTYNFERNFPIFMDILPFHLTLIFYKGVFSE
jgi:hypothetical protein